MRRAAAASTTIRQTGASTHSRTRARTAARTSPGGHPSGEAQAEREDALAAVAIALRSGAIVAVKGIGGYHLVVDAADHDAVAELRRRKARDDKPFAVMVADLATAEQLAEVGEDAVLALTSAARPVVLCPRRPDAAVAPGVAPGWPTSA